MKPRIAVVSLWAEDIPAAAHFYRDVLGFDLLPHPDDRRLHFDVEGCILAIIGGRPALPPDRHPRFPAVAFSVPDLGTAMENLRAHGVDLPWGVETNDSTRWVMFRDPAGNLLELFEYNK